MTGEQLETSIKMMNDMLDDFDLTSPELSNHWKRKRILLKVLEDFSSEERKKHFKKEMDKLMSSYALNMINRILINDNDARYLDYSPMHGLIARYGLRLSNVCDYLGISTNARTSISKNEAVHMDILIQIADFLECGPDELYSFIDSEEKSKREMKESLVRDSRRVVYKEKEIPVPTAVLREMRDTDKSKKTDSSTMPFNNWKNSGWYTIAENPTFTEYANDFYQSNELLSAKIKKYPNAPADTASKADQIKFLLQSMVDEMNANKKDKDNNKED